MTVIVMGGLAGAGKTSLSRALLSEIGAALISKDTACTHLVEALMQAHGEDPHDRSTEIYRKIVRPLEYQTMIDIAADCMLGSRFVVIEAPFCPEFSQSSWRDDMTVLARESGHEVVFVWVDAADDLLRQRIVERDSPRDAAKIADWEQFLDSVAADRQACRSGAHVVVETTGSNTAEVAAGRLLGSLMESDRIN